MPRRAYPSRSLSAAVRAHFGLSQAELAAFVGVSRAHLGLAEAGHKTLGPGPDQRLQVLARQLPPPDGQGPPAPAFGDEAGAAGAAPSLDPAADPEGLAALRRRLGRCQWLRTQLLFETEQQRQPGQARHQRRLWAVRVLEPLLAAPLPRPDWLAPGGPALPLPAYPLATPDAPRDTHWLSGLALRLAATTPPLPLAAAALARARLAGLDTEIQLITEAIGAGMPGAGVDLMQEGTHSYITASFPPVISAPMAYSLKLLTTRAQCDVVLAYANAKLSLLNYHDTQTGRRADNLTASTLNDTSELTSLNAYITGLTPVVATLPPGKDRTRQENELRLRIDRRDTLLARQSQQGPEALVEAELDATLVDAQLPLVQELVAQVTAHRATLPA